MKPNKKLMRKSFQVAKDSAEKGDYPIGALISKNGEVVSLGYEKLKQENDPVNGHAEIDAIRKACQKLNSPYLEGCVLYSTHEPCPMCASASVWAKIDSIVFSVTREDMIREMKKKAKKDSSFSWRQIDIPCLYVLKKGEPTPEMHSGFLREEGLKLFNLTK